MVSMLLQYTNVEPERTLQLLFTTLHDSPAICMPSQLAATHSCAPAVCTDLPMPRRLSVKAADYSCSQLDSQWKPALLVAAWVAQCCLNHVQHTQPVQFAVLHTAFRQSLLFQPAAPDIVILQLTRR